MNDERDLIATGGKHMSPDTRFRGVEFIDKNLHLNPGLRSAGDSCGTVCMVFTNGPWKGWICYKHPDGQVGVQTGGRQRRPFSIAG